MKQYKSTYDLEFRYRWSWPCVDLWRKNFFSHFFLLLSYFSSQTRRKARTQFWGFVSWNRVRENNHEKQRNCIDQTNRRTKFGKAKAIVPEIESAQTLNLSHGYNFRFMGKRTEEKEKCTNIHTAFWLLLLVLPTALGVIKLKRTNEEEKIRCSTMKSILWTEWKKK